MRRSVSDRPIVPRVCHVRIIVRNINSQWYLVRYPSFLDSKLYHSTCLKCYYLSATCYFICGCVTHIMWVICIYFNNLASLPFVFYIQLYMQCFILVYFLV